MEMARPEDDVIFKFKELCLILDRYNEGNDNKNK